MWIICKEVLQIRGSETQNNTHIPNSKYIVNGSVSQAMAPLMLFLFPLLLLLEGFTRAHCQFRTQLKNISVQTNLFLRNTNLQSYSIIFIHKMSIMCKNIQQKMDKEQLFSVNCNYDLFQP